MARQQLSQSPDWAKIQDIIQNSVVQVFAQLGKFNWAEPYKIGDEGEGRGSGFLINEQGYIVTNAHVVHEAKRVWVHMPAFGRHTIHVDVVGFCPERDLALLKIKPKELKIIREHLKFIPYLELGDSDLVQRTDNVMVLGYPLGQYRLKTTIGIVSGREASRGQALIQMTAPVNPGSSGGPLLSTEGKVIGITVATIQPANSVGYAIAINELKQILDELYETKLVRMPLLGAQFVVSSDSKADYLGNPKPSGLYIARVLPDSLFDDAGVQPGDMLYEFNGFRIDAFGESTAPWGADKTTLMDLVARVTIGDEINMVIYRNGKRKNISCTYELKDPFAIRVMYPDFEPIYYETIGGMVIMELADNHLMQLIEYAPDLIKYVDPQEKVNPVLVISHVLPGSLVYQLRSIMPGDIIKEINEQPVGTLDEFSRAMQKSVKTGFFTIKTHRDIFAVFSLHDLLEDEKQLSKDFVYPLSKLVSQLLKSNGKA